MNLPSPLSPEQVEKQLTNTMGKVRGARKSKNKGVKSCDML